MKNNKDVYMSIKPNFVELIINNKKNYEFRKYVPNKGVDRIFVYETLPKARIKYVIEITNIYEYPYKIDTYGVGNVDFNDGNKKSKFAYKIGKIYFLENEILLKELKEKYKFTAPQSYAYTDKYLKLTNYINENLRE